VYVFHLENFLAVLDDSPAEIRIGSNTFQAQLLSSQGLEVEIGIERSCGNSYQKRGYKLISGICSNYSGRSFAEYQNGSATFDFHLSEYIFEQQSRANAFHRHS